MTEGNTAGSARSWGGQLQAILTGHSESAQRGHSPILSRGSAWALACLLSVLALSVPELRAQPEASPLAGEQQSAPVNINTAEAAELAERLSGVGANRAEAIVRYREQFGPFESIEELTEVTGIGLATVERNRDIIRLR